MSEETPGASRFEPLSALWRILAAAQTLLVLLGLLALSLALSTLIPQIPAQARSDPQAWLSVQSGLLGQGSSLLHTLGLFNLLNSFGFRLLLVAIGLCLFVRFVEGAELAWRATGRSSWTETALGFWGRRPPQIELLSHLSQDEIETRLDEALVGQGYWLRKVPTQRSLSLVAGRRSLVLWARPLGYGASLLALIFLAIVATWGWRSEPWRHIPGEGRALGHETPYTIRLDRFHMRLGEDQRLESTYSEITWLEGDAELGQDLVRTGQPAVRGGVALRQIGYVPVVRMRGWDEDGRPLMLETGEDVLSVTGVTEIRFGSPQDQPVVLVPDHDLFLALTFDPLCAEGRPALHIDRIHEEGSRRQSLGILYESGQVLVDGFQLDVEFFLIPILRADSLPAIWLVMASMVLVLISLAAIWIVPPSLVWLALLPGEGDQTRAQVLALPGAGITRWLPQLVKRLRRILRDDA